jgi:hypothetical protein
MSKRRHFVPKVNKKVRRDGTLSRPDAILTFSTKGFSGLVGDEIALVADAKYYKHSDLGKATIDKTRDDMKLRNTPLGIIVCSDETKISSENESLTWWHPEEFSQEKITSKRHPGLRMVMLKESKKFDIKFLKELSENTTQYEVSDFLPEYLTRSNLNLLKDCIEENLKLYI